MNIRQHLNKFTVVFFCLFFFSPVLTFGQKDSMPSSKTYILTDILPKSVRDSIVNNLELVSYEDQKYRNELENIAKKFGGDSKEMKSTFAKMRKADSLNLIQVSKIINKYGWLGSDLIGEDANKTLFMVIQHADKKSQEYFLPLMQDAVKNKKLKASSFALLIDRLAISDKKKQVYGSQVVWNMKTNTYYVFPIEDPDNVDKRRASVGLLPISIYILDCCNLIWDLNDYKKDIFSLKSANNN